MNKKGKYTLLACLLLTLGLTTSCSETNESSTSPSSTTDSSFPSSTVDSSSGLDENSSFEPEEVFYDLSFVLDDGITATFTVNNETVTSATEGSIVVISYALQSDYELVSFTSEQVTISQTAGQYHFTMPANDVKVVATTSLKESYDINVVTTEGVEQVSLTVGGDSVTQATAGSTVIVSITIADRYTFKSIDLDNASLTTLKYGVTYSFTMPSSSVTLNVATDYVPNQHKLTSLIIIDTENITDVSIQAGATLTERETITFTFEGTNGLDYLVEVIDENDKEVDVSVLTRTNLDGETSIFEASFIMPDADVDIILSSWALTVDNGAVITINEMGEGHYKLYGITSGQKYESGASLFIIPEDGYLPTVTSNEATIVQNGNAYVVEFSDTDEVTINISSQYTGLADITLESNSRVSLQGQTTGVTVGSLVNLLVVADDGYVLESAKVNTLNNEEVESDFDNQSGNLTFLMPEGGAVVSVSTLQINKLSYVETDAVSDVLITNTDKEEITEAVTGDEILIFLRRINNSVA